MSDIHELDFVGPAPSPQAACARAMRERRPFTLAVDFKPSIGDLILFPDFFVSYPVIRYATSEEAAVHWGLQGKRPARKFRKFRVVVCREPDLAQEFEIGSTESAEVNR